MIAIFSIMRGASSVIQEAPPAGDDITFLFEEAASTSLETINSTWGGSSTEFVTTGDGKLVPTVPWDARKALWESASGGAQSIEVEWSVGQGFSSGQLRAVAVRAQAAVNGYSSQVNIGPNSTSVRVTLNKDVTQIANIDIDIGVDITTVTHLHKISISATNDLAVFYNGVEVLNSTDSTDPITEGHPAFATYPAGTVSSTAINFCTVSPA